MRYSRPFFLIVTFGALLNLAAGKQTPKVKSESSVFLGKVAGVYKEQFQNAFVNGEKYPSEDVLEVVPVDDHAAYVRMDLEFANDTPEEFLALRHTARTLSFMTMVSPATNAALSSTSGLLILSSLVQIMKRCRGAVITTERAEASTA
jgi:hypothetical protein